MDLKARNGVKRILVFSLAAKKAKCNYNRVALHLFYYKVYLYF